MRCSATGGLVFFITLYAAANVWSAIDIFVFGRFEEKLGGPLENLLLGLQVSAIAFAFLALGFILATLILVRCVRALRGKACWLSGVVGAGIAFGLLVAGWLPWFQEIVPWVSGPVDMALGFIAFGAAAACLGALAVSFFGGRLWAT